MLISAFYLEYFHGALPCDLCITQRWFHSAIITYSLIIIFFLNNQNNYETISNDCTMKPSLCDTKIAWQSSMKIFQIKSRDKH